MTGNLELEKTLWSAADKLCNSTLLLSEKKRLKKWVGDYFT